MARVRSRNFGSIEFIPGEQFVFPKGIPGFPDETEFLPIEVPDQLPLVYLQSLRTWDLCFVAAPVNCVMDDYQVHVQPNDLSLIELDPASLRHQRTLCLALICFGKNGTATVNLRAPIVVNLRTRRAVQAIRDDERYPLYFSLGTEGGSTCS